MITPGRRRREAERAAAEARQLFEEAQRLGHMGSYDLDLATDTNTWTDELYRIYGTEPQSFNASYERFMAFVHPDDRAMVEEVHAQAFATGGSYEMELRIIRPDGEERVLWSNGEVITDAGRRPVRVRGTCIDVTERRQADQRAALADRRVAELNLRRRQALEINDNIVQGLTTALLSLERGSADAAETAVRATLDTSRQMMDDLLVESSASPDHRHLKPGDLVRERPVRPVVPEWPEAGTERPTRPTGPHRTGTRHPSTPRAVVVDDSADLRLLLSVSLASGGYEVVAEGCDGVEAVQLAERLRPDLMLLDLAMPVMDGLTALPAIRSASPSTRVLVLSGFDDQRTRAAAMAAGAHGYAPKGARTGALLEAAAALCPPAPIPRPPPVTDPDPLCSVPSVPAPALDHLIHELRTPATVLRGLIQTLVERIDQLPSATVTEILAALSRNVENLAELMEATGDAHRVAAGGMALHTEPTDLVALVHDTVADLTPVIGDHDVSIEAPDRLALPVDRLRVRQVVANVLTNAAKFSEPGAPIEVTVRPGLTAVEISVTDHGCGIPPAQRANLFQRFGRLGHDAAGLGLGLFLSRGIAEAHGGTLTLERSGPRGSTFVLTLPRADVPAEADYGG